MLRFVLRTWLVFVLITSHEAVAQKKPVDVREKLKLIESIELSGNEIYQASLTDEDELFVTMRNRVTGEWSYQIGNRRQTFPACGKEGPFIVVPKLKQNKFVISCHNFWMEVWDFEMKKRLFHFQIEKDKKSEGRLIYVSPDGKRMIFKPALSSTEAELWDIELGKRIAVLDFDASGVDCDTCNRTVYRMVFSPDSSKVAVSFGPLVVLWNARTGKLLNHLADEKIRVWRWDDPISHGGAVREIIFNRDGSYIFTGGYEGIVKMWEVESGRLLRVFKEHRGRVGSMALSPDEKILASAGTDERVKLWDIETGKLLVKSGEHDSEPLRIRFDRNGKRVLSITEKGAYIWDVATGKLLEKMRYPLTTSVLFSSDWRLVYIVDQKKEVINVYEYEK